MKPATLLFICMLMVTALTGMLGEEPKEASATETARRFYQTYARLNPLGLPKEEAMKEFVPLFSAELVELFAAAKREQEKTIRENPDEKAPWSDANLFTSNFEGGVDSFSLGAPSGFNDKTSIPVYLERREGEVLSKWIDVIVLERSDKGWKVWDIFMNAPWSFRTGPSLRAALARE